MCDNEERETKHMKSLAVINCISLSPPFYPKCANFCIFQVYWIEFSVVETLRWTHRHEMEEMIHFGVRVLTVLCVCSGIWQVVIHEMYAITNPLLC